MARPVAGVFAGLKLRLLRNGLRRPGRAFGFWAGAAAGTALGLALFAALANPPAGRDDRLALAVLVATALWVGWILFPLLAFGSDETLDPARLALLPLTSRQLITGLLVASAVGVVPLACLVGLAGAVPGFGGGGAAAAAIVAAAVLILLALCLATSRAVTTALSGALRSRRWRDVTLVVLSLLGLVAGWGRFFVGDALERLGDDVVTDAAHVLQWTPPGLVGRAIVDAGDGAVAAPVAALAVAGWAVVAALAGWARALERSTAQSSTGTTTRERTGPPGSLFPRFAPFLPRTRAGAVAAKDLRYLWRDPRGRSQLVSGVPVALGLPLFGAAAADGGQSVLLATGAAVVMGLNQMNMFGLDGGALWMNVTAGHDPRADLVGKTVAAVTVAMTVTTAAAVATAAVTGGWAWLPLGLALGAGVAGVMAGIGAVFSVRRPLPLPDARGNLFASPGAGSGCATALVLMGGYVLEAVLFTPVALLVAAGLRSSPVALVAAGLVAPFYGWLVWRVALGLAADYAADHQPELLAGVTPQRG